MRPKPKVLLDIKHPRGGDSFSGRPQRVNLSYSEEGFLLKFLPKSTLFTVAILLQVFFLSQALAPVTNDVLAQISSTDRQALENQLQELESQISQYEKTINEYQRQGSTLKNEVQSLEARIAKLNLEIRATLLSLNKLDDEITLTTRKISEIEADIGSNRLILADAIQNMYENERTGLFEVLLANPKLSVFFTNLNNLVAIQDNLRESLEKLRNLRVDLVEEKENLSLERTDVSALKSYQESRKKEIEDVKKEKDNLLKVTKGKESEYQKLLTATKKTAAQIRSRIFELLGGGELSFEQAYKLAKFAEDVTGVRAALILAVLDRESALGQNVGRCKYNDINPSSGKTVMNPTRDTPFFLEITRELGINPDSVTVSCANRDGTYGGAMGPAQFIPSTWNIYKSKITSVTGSNPPSPWRNNDAFVATALYLKDAGATNSERIAAARYYCGGRWNRYVCLNVYGTKVVEQARQFQKDIDILNS